MEVYRPAAGWPPTPAESMEQFRAAATSNTKSLLDEVASLERERRSRQRGRDGVARQAERLAAIRRTVAQRAVGELACQRFCVRVHRPGHQVGQGAGVLVDRLPVERPGAAAGGASMSGTIPAMINSTPNRPHNSRSDSFLRAGNDQTNDQLAVCEESSRRPHPKAQKSVRDK